MKKSIFLVLAMLLGTSMIFAQPFEKGAQAINVDIGFGNTGYMGTYYKGFVPSISGSYEYGIVEVPMGSELTGVVSVGGYLGWSTATYAYWSSDIKRVYNNITFGARGNYHFIFHDKLDTYAGVWLGYRISNGKWKGDSTIPPGWDDVKSSSVVGGAYVGARWYFTDSFAVNAELGYLISILNLGITFKIPAK